MNSTVQVFSFPGPDTPLSLRWCCTRFKVMKSVHYWCIKNFSFCMLEGGENIESSVFHLGPNAELGFRLKLYPRGIATYGYYNEYGIEKEYISVFLGLVSTRLSTNAISVKFRISFLNAGRKEIKALSCKRTFSIGRFRGWYEFLDRKELFKSSSEFYPADQLLVCCEIAAAVEDESLPNLLPVQMLKIPKCQLAEDMATLYKSQKFSDLTILVHDKAFLVHKAILAARSPVFAAMFQHDMMEKTCGTVKITDFDAEVINKMLQFMYSGDVCALDKQRTKELLSAADKYGVESLKQACEDQLCKMINFDTVLEILSLAERHSAKRLKTNCLQFVACFADHILNEDKQKTFTNLQPSCLDDIVKAIAFPLRPREIDTE